MDVESCFEIRTSIRTACKYSRLACRRILRGWRETPHTLEVKAVVFSSLFCVRAGLLAGSSSEVSDGCQPSSGPWLGNLPPLIKSAEMHGNAKTCNHTAFDRATLSHAMLHRWYDCSYLAMHIPGTLRSRLKHLRKKKYIYIYM